MKRPWTIWLAIGCVVVLGLGGANLTWGLQHVPVLDVQAQTQPNEPDEIFPPEPLTDVEGFAYIDNTGSKHAFESVEELELWVHERAELGPGEDIVLLKQRIGERTGLLVIGGSKEITPLIREGILNPTRVTVPMFVVPPSRVMEEARSSALEIARKGRSISLRELHELGLDFNKATAAEADSELTDAVVELFRDLAREQ